MQVPVVARPFDDEGAAGARDGPLGRGGSDEGDGDLGDLIEGPLAFTARKPAPDQVLELADAAVMPALQGALVGGLPGILKLLITHQRPVGHHGLAALPSHHEIDDDLRDVDWLEAEV